MKVKITKVGISKDPVVPTPDSKDYIPGVVNKGVSIPVDYWIIGELMAPIEVGLPIMVLRSERNGVKCQGIFRSSPISKLKDNVAETDNSRYEIEYLS